MAAAPLNQRPSRLSACAAVQPRHDDAKGGALEGVWREDGRQQLCQAGVAVGRHLRVQAAVGHLQGAAVALRCGGVRGAGMICKEQSGGNMTDKAPASGYNTHLYGYLHGGHVELRVGLLLGQQLHQQHTKGPAVAAGIVRLMPAQQRRGQQGRGNCSDPSGSIWLARFRLASAPAPVPARACPLPAACLMTSGAIHR